MIMDICWMQCVVDQQIHLHNKFAEFLSSRAEHVQRFSCGSLISHAFPCEAGTAMALLSVCMRQAPCGTAADAIVSRLRWAALVTQLSSHRAAAPARGHSCRSVTRHESHGLRPNLHIQQVCAVSQKTYEVQ